MPRKPDWFYNQSSVIPYFFKSGKAQIILITSRSGKRWIIPKGIIEPNLSPQDSAAKEALEEAGVTGTVSIDPVSGYTFKKWGGKCHVQVYAMEVSKLLDDWDERDQRERVVVNIDKAIEIAKPVLKPILKRFRDLHSS